MTGEAWLPTLSTSVDPEAVRAGDGRLAIDLANFAMGPEKSLDPWQEWILLQVLAKDPVTKRPLFSQAVCSLARQNGKTELATAMVLYGMLSRLDANVFSLASNLEQARIAYNRVLTTILSNRELRKRFKRATETRGIVTADGRGRYTCQPSKGTALQGHSVSMVICDELHITSPDVWNAMVIGAGQVRDSLLFGITTAGSEDSSLLLDLYGQGKAGAPGMFFALWEAPTHSKVDDLDALRAANPALACGRMSEAQILKEVALLPEVDAIRYRLNRFVASENTWLPPSAWSQCPRLDDLQDRRNIVLSVDRTPDWSAATIAAAWKQENGLIATDLIASVVRPDLDGLADLVVEVARQVPHRKVVLDGHALAELDVRLKQRGLQTQKLTLRDWIIASSICYSKITEGEVAHPHHPLLDLQMPRAIRKETGDRWRVVRSSVAVEIDAVMATIGAVYAAEVERTDDVQIF